MGVEQGTGFDGSRDELGRLTDKDTAQFAAEGIDKLRVNAQEGLDKRNRQSFRDLLYRGYGDGKRHMKDGEYDEERAASQAAHSIQTGEAKVDSLERAMVGDLRRGSSDTGESGRDSARVEEIRTRGDLLDVRAKLFGEKPVK